MCLVVLISADNGFLNVVGLAKVNNFNICCGKNCDAVANINDKEVPEDCECISLTKIDVLLLLQ